MMTSVNIFKRHSFQFLIKLKGVSFIYLKEILEEFYCEIKIRNYSARTIKDYKNDLRRFERYVKERFNIEQLENIDTKHIKQYLLEKRDNGVQTVTLNTYLKHLKVFFNFCSEEEYCNNIAKKVKRAKEPKIIINTFNDSEIVNMLKVYDYSNYLNARNKLIIAMLVDTGIRNTELCTITMEDVKPEMILIKGKGDKERFVPTSPALKKQMIKYERIRDKHLKNKHCVYNNYFLSSRYRNLTDCSIDRVVKIAGKKSKVRSEIRCSAHTIRHWYAQTQIKNGLDIYSCSRLLGHESIYITKRYLQGLKDKEVLEMGMKTSPLMNLKN